MTRDEESMALCAIRYTIGRRSYIVSDGQRWALEWGAKSEWVRDVIARDLQGAVETCDNAPPGTLYRPLGDRFDEQGWRDVLARLQAMKAEKAA